MPRRFIAISTHHHDAWRTCASWPLSAGTADAAYCAPDEIDTATVST